MIRPPASAFVGSFALFFYSQLGSSFSGTPWFVSSLAQVLILHFIALIRRKNAHDVGCDCLAKRDPSFPSSSPPCISLDIYSDVLLFRFVNLNVIRTALVEAVPELKYSFNPT